MSAPTLNAPTHNPTATDIIADRETLRLWDAPVDTPGLRWGV